MCALETFNIRQKLFAFIQYANNDKVKVFQDFHEKVELLTKWSSEHGTKNREHNRRWRFRNVWTKYIQNFDQKMNFWWPW